MVSERKGISFAIKVTCCLLVASVAFPAMDLQYATAQGCRLELTSPTLKSDSTELEGVTEGQQYFITAMLSNCNHVDISLVVIIEARNSEGVTEYLSARSATLMANDQLEVGVPWVPAHVDSYELRSFIISDLNNPEILSRLMTSKIGVQGRSTDDETNVSADVINGNNQFALNFYSKLIAKGEQGNIFYSPWSISTALALVYEGARGKTAEEIQSVFGFPVDDDARRSSFAGIQGELNNNEGNYTLTSANALWIDEGFKLSDDYVSVARQSYGSEVTNVDFPSEESRLQINGWVESKTNDKIKDLIPQGILNELSRLVITNAIYFKGTWVTQFDEKDTAEEDFRVDADNTVKIPMMKLDEAYFRYAETDSLQIVELPYQGEKVSMLVLLPKGSVNLATVEESLTLENLSTWKSNLRNQSVIVNIPKFKLETDYTLNAVLADLGMSAAFSPVSADLSGITGSKELYIQAALHKAFVEVNEEGTEAAAATGMVFGTTSVHVTPLFRADHPFIFVLQDSETGNILFMGRVTNPAE